MSAKSRLQRFQPVFAGLGSKELWKEIDDIPAQNTQDAVYDLALHAQQLEGIVESLEERISELEKYAEG